ncbi:MAG: response regulator transcription factor [Streptosporangiaceae bacterium]|nr:response regulator transcription factor [Streptosporangiaceae bacterium]
MIRVVVVDDHPVARLGVEHIVAGADDMRLAGAVSTEPELAVLLGRQADDCPAGSGEAGPLVVVLDLYLDDGQPAFETIARFTSRAHVLAMSASRRPGDVLGAISAGASGYIAKDATPSVFLAALRTAAAGGFALSAQLADILRAEVDRPGRRQQRPDAPDGVPALTPRELEALGLIARGFTHAQAATRMGVTPGTVNTFIERVRRKLQVGNKAELARVAIDLRLITPDNR